MKRYSQAFAIRLLPLILTITGMWVSPAAAHRVTIFAWVDGDMVHTESKFSGGKKVIDGRVVATDLQGNRLVEGRTDENGAFSFKLPQRTPIRIELIAGMGHRGERVIRADGVAVETGETSAEDLPRATDPDTSREVPTSAPTLGEAEIERIVEAVLDRKLEPVKRMIADNRSAGPSISDIIGGLGYILGLVGLAAYVNYRRKSKDRFK